jgi:hypothetical protein
MKATKEDGARQLADTKRQLADTAATIRALADLPDETPVDIQTACFVVGGTKPVSVATVWRMIKRGEIEPPTGSGAIRRLTLGNLRKVAKRGEERAA